MPDVPDLEAAVTAAGDSPDALMAIYEAVDPADYPPLPEPEGGDDVPPT